MFAFGPKQVAFITSMNFGLVLLYSHMSLSGLCTLAILQSQAMVMIYMQPDFPVFTVLKKKTFFFYITLKTIIICINKHP